MTHILQPAQLSSTTPAHQVLPPPTDEPPQKGKVSFEILQKQEAFEEEKAFFFFFKSLGRALTLMWGGGKFGFSGNQP